MRGLKEDGGRGNPKKRKTVETGESDGEDSD